MPELQASPTVHLQNPELFQYLIGAQKVLDLRFQARDAASKSPVLPLADGVALRHST